MVVPIVMSFAAAGSAIAAAGGVMAAMSTFGGFLAVAGAALTGIGALTGKKDLVKVGSLMTLGSSLAGAASSASSTAATEAAAKEGASSASSDSFGTAFDADAAAAAESSASPTTAGMEQATQGAARAGVNESAIDPIERANQAFEGAQSNVAGGNQSIMDSAREAFRRGEFDQSSIYAKATPPSGVTIGGDVMNMPSAGVPQAMNTTDLIAQYARNTPASQMQAANANSVARAATNVGNGGKALSLGEVGDWLGNKVGEFGQWVERNPNVALVGGKMLASALGPDAEAIDLQRSIYERRRANLNRPVALTFGKA